MNRTQRNTNKAKGMSDQTGMSMGALHQLAWAGVALTCVLLGALILASVPAAAATQYPLLKEITGAETPQGEFNSPARILIDGVSKQILIASHKGEGKAEGEFLESFSPSGAFESQLLIAGEGAAVNESTGDIYVPTAEFPNVGVIAYSVAVYSSTGVFLFKFEPSACEVRPYPEGCFEAQRVAIDQANGDVYVYDRNAGVIDMFNASGVYLSQITNAGGQSLVQSVSNMAVDSVTGDLLLSNAVQGGRGVVYVFDAATGAYLTTWDGSNTPQGALYSELEDSEMPIAVNEATGDVYVSSSLEPLVGNPEELDEAPGAVIDQFESSGAYVGQVRDTPSGSLHQVRALAVDPASDELYAAVWRCTDIRVVEQLQCPTVNDVVDVFAGTGINVPHVALGSPVVGSISATLHGFVNPEKTGEATCEFEYGTSIAYGERASCGSSIPEGNSAVAVEAELSGLQRDTTYYYRLDGKNVADGGVNTGEGSEDIGEFHTSGPGVRDGSVSDVSATSAAFGATIDPDGEPTRYYFQYGIGTEYGEYVPAVPGETIGSGSGYVVAPSLYVRGLSPSTLYHYRVVVVSETGPGVFETVEGPDRTFATQAAGGSFALADGRQWELVSPASKLGSLIEEPGGSLMQASGDGDAIAYLASSPTEDESSGGFAKHERVLAGRLDAGGWSSQDISEPNIHAVRFSEGIGSEFEIFSDDLAHAILVPQDKVFTPLSSEASETTAYLRTDYLGGNAEDLCTSSCYRPLVTGEPGFANVPAGTVFGEEIDGSCEAVGTKTCGPLFQGANADLSHIVLSSPAQLTSTPAPAGGPGLYEWSNGSLELLDVLPEGEEGPAVLAGSGHEGAVGVRGSVSEDGGRVILEGGAEGGRGLYLRVTQPLGETLRLDVPQGGKGPSEGMRYMDSADDASRIFFLDSGRLMADSSPGGSDLYEYDLNAPAGSRLSDLTADPNAGRAADTAMMIGASEDGSYVYFAAAGALTPDASEGACPSTWATGTECNLYVRHEGVTSLVATLPSEDVYDWYRQLHGQALYEKGLYARVSPNGRWLAFLSAAELTGYDTHDAVSGKPDVEVYLYDAVSHNLVCASCDPTGARPVGMEINESSSAFGKYFSEFHQGGQWGAASVPPWSGSPYPNVYGGSSMGYQPRYLSDSGRLFFDSLDALVAQDVNGVEDVYEYEPAGVGSCGESSQTFSSRSEGCVDLVSAGTSSDPSKFVDASETGGDVFFRTKSQLAPQDYDSAYDIYDAHECTGAEPCMPTVIQTPPCETESSCRVAPTPQPALYGAPASATFSGAGNVIPVPPSKKVVKTAKCAKGHVKNKKGKCVKQKQTKKDKRAGNKRRASR